MIKYLLLGFMLLMVSVSVPTLAEDSSTQDLPSDDSTSDSVSTSEGASPVSPAVGEKESKEKTNARSNPKVIDFEAEIIEGERKTPTLFLQIGLEKPTMDAVLYQRKDFNDFHIVTKERRPSYQAPDKK